MAKLIAEVSNADAFEQHIRKAGELIKVKDALEELLRAFDTGLYSLNICGHHSFSKNAGKPIHEPKDKCTCCNEYRKTLSELNDHYGKVVHLAQKALDTYNETEAYSY